MAARGRPSNKSREEEIAKTLGPERVPENQKREIYERVRRAVDAKNGICTNLKVGASAWDKHERKILEEGLRYFPHDRHSNMSIYIRIAASLPKKTARDVAHYLRQMQDAHRAKLEAAVGMNAPKPHHPDPATAAAMAAMHEHQMAAMFAANAASMAPMPGMNQGLSGPEGPGPHLKDEKVEARVCTLLQENMGLIGNIRENIMMGRFFDNHSLMITFDKNIKEITAMLEALPTADTQKLPVQVNPYFITGSLPTGMGALQPPGSLTHQPLAHRYFSSARGDDRNEGRTGGAAVGIVDVSAAPITSVGGNPMVSSALLQQPPQLWPFVAPTSQPQTPQSVPQAADVLAAAEATFSAAAAAIANVPTGREVEVVPMTEEGKVVAPEPALAETQSTVQTAPTQDTQL